MSMPFVLYDYMWFLQGGGCDFCGAWTCRCFAREPLHDIFILCFCWCGLGIIVYADVYGLINLS